MAKRILIFDKKGNEHYMTHDIDAYDAVKSGYFSFSDPLKGKKKVIPVAVPVPEPIVELAPVVEVEDGVLVSSELIKEETEEIVKSRRTK